MVNSEASIAGFTLQVDPEVPGDVHRHLARLPLGAGRVQGPGTQVRSEWSSLIGPDQSRYCALIGPDQSRYCALIGPDQSRYCALIGPDTVLSLVQISPDTLLSLAELYYAGAKVYGITTNLMASKMSPTRGILCISLCCYGNAPEGGHFVL